MRPLKNKKKRPKIPTTLTTKGTISGWVPVFMGEFYCTPSAVLKR